MLGTHAGSYCRYLCHDWYCHCYCCSLPIALKSCWSLYYVLKSPKIPENRIDITQSIMTNRSIQTASLLVIAIERNSSIITEVTFPSSPLTQSQAPKEVHFRIAALWHPQRKRTHVITREWLGSRENGWYLLHDDYIHRPSPHVAGRYFKSQHFTY